jgi:hypothetical protein
MKARQSLLRSLAGKARLSGYALVELLVTGILIAVLAAVLSPTLNTAVRSSRKSKCISNMRQLSIALFAYAADHDGYLPAGAGNPDPDKQNGIGWSIVLQKLMEVPDQGLYRNNPSDVFICPEYKRTYASKSIPYNTYLMNVSGSTVTVSFRLGQCSRPSETILIAEAGPTGSSGVCTSGNVKTSNYFDWRHLGDVQNVVFVDGSLSSLSKSATSDADFTAMLTNLRK